MQKNGNRSFCRKKLYKPLLVMKITFMLLLVSVFQLSASVYSQNTRFDMKLTNKTLIEVFEEIRNNSEFSFVYDLDDVESITDINVSEQEATVEEILNSCLEDTNLTYEVIDKVVVVKQKPYVAPKSEQQEKKEIKGKVTDKDGVPLPGVSVVIKGTNVGVATNIDGEYVLEMEKNNAILIFSFVGMLPQEVVYNGQLVQDVTLIADSEQMAEVVVTGYQTISKERATGSFTIVSPEKLEGKLQSSLKSALEGQIAGLVVDKDGKIEIRGVSSFRGDNSPLVVVDGFPIEGSLETINPDNIANITVLKDAVSASIYGSRSGNGVIVVTTKKGKKGESTITYKGSYGIQLKPDLSYLNRANASDYIDAELDLIKDSPGSPTSTYNGGYNMSEVQYLWHQKYTNEISETEFNNAIDKLRENDAMSQVEDAFLREKTMQQHNINIAHGSENNIFNFSLNYNSNKNNTIYNKDNRLLIDVKNELQINDRVKLNLFTNINFSNDYRTKETVRSIAYMGYEAIKPYTDFYDKKTGEGKNIFYGNPGKSKFYSDLGLKDLTYNPIDDFKEGLAKNSTLGVRLGGQLKVKITDALSCDVGYSYSKRSSNIKAEYSKDSYLARKMFNQATDADNHAIHYIPEGGIVQESRNYSYDYTLRGQLNYKKEFNDNHRVTALLGAEKRRNVINNNKLDTRFGYNDLAGSYEPINSYELSRGNKNTLYKWFRLSGNDIGSYRFVDNRYISFYANGSYEAFDKYIISTSVRIDQSNLFGADPKYKYTPLWSVGFNYKLSKEDFFDVDFVNNLQLRASYGINGNVARENGPYLIIGRDRWRSDILGLYPWKIQSPPNNSLRWERTKSYNFGLDASLLNNNINLTVDGYVKNSDDLLAYDNVDPTHGVKSILKNVGEIQNKGVEFTLNTNNIKNDNFKWSSTISVSFNKTEVKKLSLNYKWASQYMYPTALKQGSPLNPIFSYRFAELDDKGVCLWYNKDGDKIKGQDLEIEDIKFEGTYRPKYNISFINNLTYKNFDLSFMFLYKGGHKIRKDAFQGSSFNHADVGKRWKKPGDEKNTVVPKLSGWNSDMWYVPYADINVISGNYLKLRDVTLTYNIPELLTEKIGFSNCKLSFQARNLFVIAANKEGIDPSTYELNTTGSSGAMTSQSARTMPVTPELYLGISLNF
ncbi:SusC/RagA family TonB-linked outer membrane protein [Marinifilum sp. D737]|uniref:SusC/RagA family TonB-linked outer membrane protein n=1 Tax=Marinifilum sp. D737 TaxID=2969628 RepID=UPI002275D5CC|nr:SusC/RagA family TonB-linked outer membrane protein [Marinifilum sp. D737]MCY1636326.1 SusC/RagA family TonB-linked outer membrane protein [Marinifilum sp. D737]